MQERLDDLETRLAFQDDTVQQLSDIVARQQKEIDQLREMVQVLNKELKALSSDTLEDEGMEPPPPHY